MKENKRIGANKYDRMKRVFVASEFTQFILINL